MNPLEVVNLTSVMALTSGRPEIVIGLIDGPVAMDHPDLTKANLREVSGRESKCHQNTSAACLHGTYIAGILCAARPSPAPGLCPDCTVLVRPIFAAAAAGLDQMPSATPEELAAAIVECIAAGARLLNLSVALSHPSGRGERRLEEALDYAAQRGVIPVAAAGNQGTLGSSAITRHPWVIPVIAYDSQGRPRKFFQPGKIYRDQGFGRTGA